MFLSCLYTFNFTASRPPDSHGCRTPSASSPHQSRCRCAIVVDLPPRPPSVCARSFLTPPLPMSAQSYISFISFALPLLTVFVSAAESPPWTNAHCRCCFIKTQLTSLYQFTTSSKRICSLFQCAYDTSVKDVTSL